MGPISLGTFGLGCDFSQKAEEVPKLIVDVTRRPIKRTLKFNLSLFLIFKHRVVSVAKALEISYIICNNRTLFWTLRVQFTDDNGETMQYDLHPR